MALSEAQVRNTLLPWLEAHAVDHLSALHDLRRRPSSTSGVVVSPNPLDLSFLVVSSHPVAQGHQTLLLGGKPESAPLLFEAAKIQGPFLVRDSPQAFAREIEALFPTATRFDELRMEIARVTYRPVQEHVVRQLTARDATAISRFFATPEQFLDHYKTWVHDTLVFGGFDGTHLAALGSIAIVEPEAALLVSIETHPRFRRRGWGTSVTSALVAQALQHSHVAVLSVRSENVDALSVYKRLGFRVRDERVSFDTGTGLLP